MGKPLNPATFLAIQVFFFVVNGLKESDRGFSIKLIHRDSLESPLYDPKLTETQRTENLILQSKVRSTYLARYKHHRHDPNPNTTQKFDTKALRSKVANLKNSVFIAEVGIGTFGSSAIPYFLHLDTGSSLSWIQCEGCLSSGHHCFHQNEQVFPDSWSQSYHKLPCKRHPLCFHGQCLGNFCSYKIEYQDSSSTEGFLAAETFAFGSASEPSGWETVEGIVFGCGFDQQNMQYGSSGKVAGLMGLGWGPHSLLAQLRHRAQLRFSYCLVLPNSNATASYLRFGSDIPSSPARLRTTELVQISSSESYIVNLVDISVADRRLGIPVQFFSRRPHLDRLTGVIIDSGASYSHIVQPAYEILEEAMVRHLISTIPGLTRIHMQHRFKLCFRRPGSETDQGVLNGLPSLTFHFRGGVEMVVQPEGVFFVSGDQRNMFCMTVVPSDYRASRGGVTTIGAYQQTNHRFIFDVGLKRLSFGPENCARNG